MSDTDADFITGGLSDLEYERLSRLSYQYLRQKRGSEARAVLRYMVLHWPSEAWVWFNLGIAESRLNNKKAALFAFEAALLNNPGDYDTCIRLARIELRLLRWRAAWRHAVQAWRLAQADPELLKRPGG